MNRYDVYQYNAYSDCYNLIDTVRTPDGKTACVKVKMNNFICGGLYYLPSRPNTAARVKIPSKEFRGEGM